jgi:3-oxosteroid 1-dehydrogenase
MYMIYDQRSAELFKGAFPFPASPAGAKYVISGQTLEELAANIEGRLLEIEDGTGGAWLDEDFVSNLAQSIERFNTFATSGKDADFGRGGSNYDTYWHEVFSPMAADTGHAPNPFPNITMHPLSDEGPFYAIMLVAGALDTCGGPAINASAQVLASNGEPIPGLYAAGNCVASPSKEAYFGAGHTLGMAVTFGYIAANAAHERAG